MAGKFTDTKYASTVDNLVSSINSKIDNPYYKFNDKKGTKTNYYRQNVEMSTLDESSALNYEHVGNDSPFKFNLIQGLYLYGIERINVDYDVSDFGTEANAISGTAIVLPNTIEPRPGDFFEIDYLKEKGLLFKVNKVSIDTLDTGANIYQIDYQLELTGDAIDKINSQVGKKYKFIINNVGTDFKTVITEDEFELIDNIETIISELISYYNAFFFNDKLQTYIYMHNGYRMYDPYLIEFLSKNNILSYGDTYTYISHATTLEPMFPLNYSKTIFYQLENKDFNVDFESLVTADIIADPNSLFVTRLDEYYMIRYKDSSPLKTRLNVIDVNLLEGVRSRKYLDEYSNDVYNFIISFFKDEVSTRIGNVLEMLKHFDYDTNSNCFYCIPIVIFILQNYIKTIIS